MSIGITNTTTISFDNITYITNVSSFPEMLIKANWTIYGGIFFFLMLLTFWLILMIVAYKIDRNNVIRHAMYSGAVISVLSFVLRGIYIIVNGVRQGLMSDFQLWIFPLVTMLLAAYLYATKNN